MKKTIILGFLIMASSMVSLCCSKIHIMKLVPFQVAFVNSSFGWYSGKFIVTPAVLAIHSSANLAVGIIYAAVFKTDTLALYAALPMELVTSIKLWVSVALTFNGDRFAKCCDIIGYIVTGFSLRG